MAARSRSPMRYKPPTSAAANGKPPVLPSLNSGSRQPPSSTVARASSLPPPPRMQALSKLNSPSSTLSASFSSSTTTTTSSSSDLGSGTTKFNKENVTVTVRFRPLNSREIQKGDEVAWYADGDTSVCSEYNASTVYAFDKVFGPATTTRGVYDIAAQQVVSGAMEGVNGTVFAYGVTSSGKTHTMHGDQKSPGIIPLAVKDVFNIIQESPGREFLLRVSYLEIYNEVINDLLNPAGQNLRVREDSHGTYVEGIKEEVVLSPAHALSLIATGEEHRHVGSNNLNLMSSRSHTIFTLTVESSARGEGSREEEVTLSQLNLIDLAGSESSKAETVGLRRKEGSYINKSLLTLGTVISKLTDGKSSHIPYRDSKLTRLLQSSLSGHGRVSLICTVTPASSSNEETHNTLKFAHRAKHVELHSSANKILDEKSLIKKYQKEITSLKQELEQLRKGMVGKPFVEGTNDDVIQLRQQLEAGQVKLQSRLEEEEQAKAALLGRIQRLTKLILVSTKNTIPNLPDRPTHRRRYSFGEEELAYLPDKRRGFIGDEDDELDVDLPELSSDGKSESANGDDVHKDDKKPKKRGMLGWFKTKKHEQLHSRTDSDIPSPTGRLDDNTATKRKPLMRVKSDELADAFLEPTQAGELFSAAVYGRRPPPTGTTMADQMDLLKEQVKMLAGEVAFCSSSLKRLSEQSALTPDDGDIQVQMKRLKEEISMKRQQMQVLERRILGSVENAPANTPQLSQTMMKLTSQLNEKSFELEIKAADNRILQEQLQSKNVENTELQSTIHSLKQQLQQAVAEKKASIHKKAGSDSHKKGHSFFDSEETSEWLNDVDLSRELRMVENGGDANFAQGFASKIIPGAGFPLQSQLFSQMNEIEKLKLEKTRLAEEKTMLEAKGQKLMDEAAYAKELATAAAVELKGLAEEVTKLSAQNAKLSTEVEALRSKAAGEEKSRREGVSMDQDMIQQLRAELSEAKRKVASLEQNEATLNRRIEEGKEREADLENDLAGMWVLVAKVKQEKERDEFEILGNGNGLESGLLTSKNNAHVEDESPVEELQCQLEAARTKVAELELGNSQLKGENLESLDLSALESLQNLHVEALTRLCQAKTKAQERLEREKRRSMEERALSRSQADSLSSIGVQHLLLEEERNGHVCKVCFEAPTAAVLLPCRHFCLCKSCAIACTECPLCRSGITDRIITFT
ncbi:kinesin-like protein KIN-7C, mitochondrial [Selaginella moellendorffii]|uniref:kinesin-like protein KIN-7C, mitochondrial n=1 Tax=Selaginella moellendorffii TaxID=88036 RepID=UPI000D1C32E3|nr:kinesin-like protein KIN-7C, mitochondrial [Selaginella moellendorffii]XP_024544971.1 kinesin-like protein KIN-7C, mitochondrial [Selaginella moellendorffii]|eukprot:XP_024544970.1 kinesin-like protein KIN-7C, mitochondrial [Selaginella moellendorffii]